ncbi:MAG TPA: FAD-binding oxidoreductase [Leptospiraceae bacterium]|nr:FAD-binding oxidoreductase [Spirochaetaceae bacterium]HBS04589.1 FAD-binding oxidoreductase [Leptospiraceae bacterium]|tara:strand:+ start:1975 stop:3645 length:1671 start_codon:yes stop_codon:yes gene_type:complete
MNTPEGSLRSLFRWGDPGEHKHPNPRLIQLMMEKFSMSPADLESPLKAGLEPFNASVPTNLSDAQIQELSSLVGSDRISTDTFDRVRAGYGKTMADLFRLRGGQLENIPDVVVYPRERKHLVDILRFAADHGISVQTRGAGSSVTRGCEAPTGGISLDLSRYMRSILKLNTINETVTVEAGMLLPDLEKQLQSAVRTFGCDHNYTLGHFPQSYEFATVGGAIVTRGAGQNSTYYGKIEHMVLSQDYVTINGDLVTKEVPAKSMGPDLDQLMMGSEGTMGILVSATLRIRRHLPGNTRRFSYMFKDFGSALDAVREVLQSQEGLPSVFRLSDPEETDVALRLYGVQGTPLDTMLRLGGYKPGSRCLLLGSADGSHRYTRMVAASVRKKVRHFGGFPTTGYVTRKWEKGRFKDPYMRDDLMDFGVIIDTLECSVDWENLPSVHETVRHVCHELANVVVMCHLSHFYPQGANLYFIFIGRMDEQEFLDYHHKVVDAIYRSGAAISHHHGIGRLLAPWYPEAMGPVAFDLIRAIKAHMDPAHILNPGVLGLKGENHESLH